MRVVLAIPVAGLVAGAALGLRWPDVPPSWLVAILCGWTLLAIHAARVTQPALLVICACGAFAVGGAALSTHAWRQAWRTSLRIVFESIAGDQRATLVRDGRQPPEDAGAHVVLSGVLRSDASRTASGNVSLSMDVEWLGRSGAGGKSSGADVNPVRGGVLLTVLGTLGPERMEAWRTGRRIRAPAELRRPTRYLDPGVPDQERELARRGVSLVGTVKSAALVELLSHGSFADEAAGSIRAWARRALADAVGRWSPRAAAIVMAIVIGDRTGLDADVQRRLQESGTYHVIAISGGNIALLAGLTLAAFRLAGLLGRTAMLCASAGLLVYGHVVGGGASVNRAVLMACVYFMGRAWDLRGPPFQALVLVAGLLVLVDPLSVIDAATLLTFGATAAIVGATPALPSARIPRLLVPVLTMAVASVAVEVVLLPVAAAFFSRVTFAGLVLNFAAIPLMALAQLAGMAALALHLLWRSGAAAIGWFAYVGAEGLVRTADAVTVAPWSTWRVPPPAPLAIAVYYGAVLAAWTMWRRQASAWSVVRQRRAAVACTAVALLAGIWLVADPAALLASRGDGRLHVVFVDVGQGDAALIRFPRGSSMLIDAGGLPGSSSFDIGDRVVGPVLRHHHVRRLDIAALTHGDADHVGGAGAVLREFAPTDVWEGVPVPPHLLLADLRRQAIARRARWTTIQRADETEVDGVRVIVRHPPVPDWERQDVRNDDSTVIELRWRDVSFVFTGDIGQEAEREIAAAFEPAPLRVLKLPHHGSTTSSSQRFIRALAPNVAVVSVGRNNNFGHPARAVLERYAAAGSALFRTDRDGAVAVDTDGTTLSVHTFGGRSAAFGPAPPTHDRATNPKT